jgi:predicted Zn-dependent protease
MFESLRYTRILILFLNTFVKVSNFIIKICSFVHYFNALFMERKLLISTLMIVSVFFQACQKPLLFGLQQQKALGLQVRDQILADPQTYPILDEKQYPQAYQYIRKITNNILNSGKVELKGQFDWEVRIIRDDKTLNAFCTPGGYIFVYTGLIKYLDTEDQLAGVMGHEIAHADRQHSARQLEKQYGVALLVEIALGKANNEQLKQVVNGLIGLKFSRNHEYEADAFSVDYLAGTQYRCNGAADFFVKIGESGGQQPPEFMSTHPNPGNRVEAINNKAKSINCSTNKPDIKTEYQKFKASLP